MKNKYKLFVWKHFCTDYTDGLAFAIAKTEEEAKELVEKELEYSPSDWGILNVYPVNQKIARAVSGGS